MSSKKLSNNTNNNNSPIKRLQYEPQLQQQQDQIQQQQNDQQQQQYNQTPSVQFQLNMVQENQDYNNQNNEKNKLFKNFSQNEQQSNQNNTQNNNQQSKLTPQQLLYLQYQKSSNLLLQQLQQSISSQSQSQLSTSSLAKSSLRRTFLMMNDDFYGSNRYSSIKQSFTKQQQIFIQNISKKISEIQAVMKRQVLLFQYEEKMKNQRIKEIQYSYVNVFMSYINLKNVGNANRLKKNVGGNDKKNDMKILLNKKDLIQIHQNFVDDLIRLKKVIMQVIIGSNTSQKSSQLSNITHITHQKNILKTLLTIPSQSPPESKPPQSFYIDFNNFFPNWQSNLQTIMQLQFSSSSSSKIQSLFQSQYTLPSKILSSLRYRDNIFRFCEGIFQRPLKQLKKYQNQLNVDFNVIYEKWTNLLFNIPNTNILKQFFQGKYTAEIQQQTMNNIKKNIITEITKFFSQKMDIKQYQKMLIELNHFAKNKNAINFLIQEIGPEDIQININLRLALLVYKKIQINRRRLEQLALMFINQIIDNYEQIPLQIKYIVHLFKKLSIQKLLKQQQRQKSSPQQSSSSSSISLKYQDLKTFFNKIIFSQIFFSTFMSLQQSHSSKSPHFTHHNNYNITMIALISQKIMFGQQFYQKFKYGYFNVIIKQYQPKIKKFISKFAENQYIKFEQKKQVENVLVTVETMKYWYQLLKKYGKIKYLESFEQRLIISDKNNSTFLLGEAEYTIDNMYLIMVIKPEINYTATFKPKEKLRRTFIQFLLSIQTINQGITYNQILQQYKNISQSSLYQNNSSTSSSSTRPSTQLYAQYLSLYSSNIQKQHILQQISQNISLTKQLIQYNKIRLQKQHNIAKNLQELYKKLYEDKKHKINKQITISYINALIMLPMTQFDYVIIDNKICEPPVNNTSSSSMKKKQKIIKDCLIDIASYFTKKYQGLDALYHILIEKIIVDVIKIEKQKNLQFNQNDVKQAVQQVIGERLYQMISLSDMQSQTDKKIYKILKKHKFVTLTHLGMQTYSQQQQILLQLSLPIISSISLPLSPDSLLQKFQQISLIIQHIVTCAGKASDMSSDVQIPLMLYILINSNIKNLHSLVEFMKIFAHKPNGSNKEGLVLTLLESTCYLIETMNDTHLTIDKEEYKRRMIQEEFIVIQ